MKLLVLAAACALLGCKDHPATSDDTPPPVAPSKVDSPPPATTPTAELPAAPVSSDGGPDLSAGDGRMAKPGWCHEDKDCKKKGEVCEKCGDQAQCTPGCHHDDQCGEGEKCGEVECARCPCPGQCEALNETPE